MFIDLTIEGVTPRGEACGACTMRPARARLTPKTLVFHYKPV
jgi:hypothetical protein